MTEEVQNDLRHRVRDAVADFRGDHGHDHPPSYTASSTDQHAIKSSNPDEHGAADGVKDTADVSNLHPVTEGRDSRDPDQHTESKALNIGSRASPAVAYQHLKPRNTPGVNFRETSMAVCEEPIKINVKGKPAVIDTQIQIYSTNSQLSHPFVSPVLGYLGGLPPLLIIAGQNEVLRDEIIFA